SMMFPTDAAMTTRRSSLSGTLAALAMGLPSYRAHCVHILDVRVSIRRRAGRVAAEHTGFPSLKEVFRHGRRREGLPAGTVTRRAAVPPSPSRQRCCLRATPDFTAASATAAATVGTTRASNIDGVMYSSLSSPLATIDASAWAAASFISSFTRLARTSSIPRKKPGKQHELLIWFG